jgi:hypothetical protein
MMPGNFANGDWIDYTAISIRTDSPTTLNPLTDYFSGGTVSVNPTRTRYSWAAAANASTSLRESMGISNVPDPAAYQAALDEMRRYLHDVACVSGPLVTTELESGPFYGYIVEWTMVAGTPWVFGKLKDLNLAPSAPVTVQDIPFNLIPYPSAELSDGAVIVVAKNLSTNPSVETNNTGWVVAADGAAILAANVAGARSTDIAAVGVASQRALWTAPGAGASAGWVGSQQEVTLPATVVAGHRYSINMWAAANIQAGAPVLGALEVRAYWQNGASTTLREDLIGTVTGGSGVATQAAIAPPVGATKVVMRVLQRVTSWPAGTIVRVYADALNVSVP